MSPFTARFTTLALAFQQPALRQGENWHKHLPSGLLVHLKSSSPGYLANCSTAQQQPQEQSFFMIRHHQLPAQKLSAISEILWLWEVIFQLVPVTKPLTATPQKEINIHFNAKDPLLLYTEVACIPDYKKGMNICSPSVPAKPWAQQLRVSFPSQTLRIRRMCRRLGLAHMLVQVVPAQRGAGSLPRLQARRDLLFVEWQSVIAPDAITASGALSRLSIFIDMNPTLLPKQLQVRLFHQWAKCLKIITQMWKMCST